MPVQDRYHGATRDVGEPASVALLRGWFATRAKMNAAAEEADADPKHLAEMEMAAREDLGRLHRALQEARSGDMKSANDLAAEYIRAKSGERRAVVSAQAAVARQKLYVEAEWMKHADREAERLAAKSAIPNASKEILDNLGPSLSQQHPRDADLGHTAAEQVRALVQSDKAGGMGDVGYDQRVREAYNSLVRAGRIDAAEAMKKELLPGITGSPNEYFLRTHASLALDDALRHARESNARYGAGLDPEAADKDFARMGIDVSTLGGMDESSDEARRARGDAPRSSGSPSSVSTKGGVVGMGAYADARRSGADPYAALEAAIAAQAKYADDLAAERRGALNRPRRPRASPFLANPNEYVSERGVSAARRVGENDPGLNREWADALGRNDGNINAAGREIASQGGIGPRFEAMDVEPFRVESGGDLGGWLAERLSAPVETDDPAGGWRYRLNPDQTIEVLVAPKGHTAGRRVQRSDPEWAPIMKAVGAKSPVGGLLVAIDNQPAEVQALFAPSRQAAARGDAAEAAALARMVTADDVRAAYGEAAQRAEHDPREMARIDAGLSALPDSLTAGWSDPFTAAIARHDREVGTGGYLASGAAAKSVGNWGRALTAAPSERARRRGLDRAEWAEQSREDEALSLRREGAQAYIDAFQRADTDEARQRVYTGWETAHRNAPNAYTAGAMEAAAETPMGPSHPRDGRLAMETTVDAFGPKMVRAGDAGRVRGPDMALEPTEIVPEPKVAEPEPDDDDPGFAAFLAEPKAAPAEDESDDPGFAAFLQSSTKGTR